MVFKLLTSSGFLSIANPPSSASRQLPQRALPQPQEALPAPFGPRERFRRQPLQHSSRGLLYNFVVYERVDCGDGDERDKQVRSISVRVSVNGSVPGLVIFVYPTVRIIACHEKRVSLLSPHFQWTSES
jgi:hypothetical protein